MTLAGLIMKSPRQWLREWLGLTDSYMELNILDGGGIELIPHGPDERAVRRRKRLAAIALSPWACGLTCALIGAFAGALAAKLF